MFILAFSYIARENSKYSNLYDINIIDNISSNVCNFSKTGTVIIGGDFNSRVNNLVDRKRFSSRTGIRCFITTVDL